MPHVFDLLLLSTMQLMVGKVWADKSCKCHDCTTEIVASVFGAFVSLIIICVVFVYARKKMRMRGRKSAGRDVEGRRNRVFEEDFDGKDQRGDELMSCSKCNDSGFIPSFDESIIPLPSVYAACPTKSPSMPNLPIRSSSSSSSSEYRKYDDIFSDSTKQINADVKTRCGNNAEEVSAIPALVSKGTSTDCISELLNETEKLKGSFENKSSQVDYSYFCSKDTINCLGSKIYENIIIEKKNCCGLDFGIAGLYIKDVDVNEISFKKGVLEQGDAVLAINDHPLTGLNDMEAFSFFAKSGPCVNMKVIKGGFAGKLFNSSFDIPSFSMQMEQSSLRDQDEDEAVKNISLKSSEKFSEDMVYDNIVPLSQVYLDGTNSSLNVDDRTPNGDTITSPSYIIKQSWRNRENPYHHEIDMAEDHQPENYETTPHCKSPQYRQHTMANSEEMPTNVTVYYSIGDKLLTYIDTVTSISPNMIQQQNRTFNPTENDLTYEIMEAEKDDTHHHVKKFRHTCNSSNGNSRHSRHSSNENPRHNRAGSAENKRPSRNNSDENERGIIVHRASSDECIRTMNYAAGNLHRNISNDNNPIMGSSESFSRRSDTYVSDRDTPLHYQEIIRQVSGEQIAVDPLLTHAPGNGQVILGDNVILKRGYNNDYIVPISGNYGGTATSKILHTSKNSHRGKDTPPSRRVSPIVYPPQSITRACSAELPSTDTISTNTESAATPVSVSPQSFRYGFLPDYVRNAHTDHCGTYKELSTSSLDDLHANYNKDNVEIDADVMRYMTKKYSEPRFTNVPRKNPPPYSSSHTTLAHSNGLVASMDSLDTIHIPEGSVVKQRNNRRVRSRPHSLTDAGVLDMQMHDRDIVKSFQSYKNKNKPDDNIENDNDNNNITSNDNFIDNDSNDDNSDDEHECNSGYKDNERHSEKKYPPKRTHSLPAVKHSEMRPRSVKNFLNNQLVCDPPPKKVRPKRCTQDNINRRKSIDSGTLRRLAEEIQINPALGGEYPIIAQLLGESRYSASERRAQALYRYKSSEALYSQF